MNIIWFLRWGLKGSIILAIIITLIFIRYQHRQINQLSEQNSVLKYQQQTLQSQLLNWRQQTEKVSAVLNHQQEEKVYLEEKNDVIRQKLRELMAQTPCANELVPDAIIGLQQDSINRRRYQ